MARTVAAMIMPLVLKKNLRAGTMTNSSTMPMTPAARAPFVETSRRPAQGLGSMFKVASGQTLRHIPVPSRKVSGRMGMRSPHNRLSDASGRITKPPINASVTSRTASWAVPQSGSEKAPGCARLGFWWLVSGVVIFRLPSRIPRLANSTDIRAVGHPHGGISSAALLLRGENTSPQSPRRPRRCSHDPMRYPG